VTGFNLLISNVRGAPIPMYVGGARTSAIYPMSIIAPGSAINVTCISYLDKVEFGITIDPKVFPDPWLLIDGLSESLGSYLKAVRKNEPQPERANAKKKRSSPRRSTTK
jgi:hypothetical protein